VTPGQDNSKAEDPKILEQELNIAAARRSQDARREFNNKMNEATIAAGQVAIRTSVLINGGAAISMLAFLGGLLTQKVASLAQLREVAGSLLWFGGGAGCGTASLGFSYLTNYCVTISSMSIIRTWTHPYSRHTKRSISYLKASRLFLWLSVAASAGSLVSFVVGIASVYFSILKLGSN
jgi:hypothetical protein